jgi:hypothetical protein
MTELQGRLLRSNNYDFKARPEIAQLLGDTKVMSEEVSKMQLIGIYAHSVPLDDR